MASCEKCWRDAMGDPDRYHELVTERSMSGRVCTPEQQAGEDAAECPKCKRRTVHQHAHKCLICGAARSGE